jgi:CBS domain-containing protein
MFQTQQTMKVQDVMTYNVQSCRPETNLATAAMQMWKGNFGALPVVNADRKVVGVITDRDICIAAGTKNRDPADIRVKEVMSGQVYACSADTDIQQAIKIMQEKQVRRLPIRNAIDGKLEGILSIDDLALHADGRTRGGLSPRDVENTLRAICAHQTEPQMAAV